MNWNEILFPHPLKQCLDAAEQNGYLSETQKEDIINKSTNIVLSQLPRHYFMLFREGNYIIVEENMKEFDQFTQVLAVYNLTDFLMNGRNAKQLSYEYSNNILNVIDDHQPYAVKIKVEPDGDSVLKSIIEMMVVYRTYLYISMIPNQIIKLDMPKSIGDFFQAINDLINKINKGALHLDVSKYTIINRSQQTLKIRSAGVKIS